MGKPNVTWPWVGQNFPDLRWSDLRSDPAECCRMYLGILPKLAASESHTDKSPVLSVLMNFNINATQSHWKQKKKKKGKVICIAGI